MALEDASDSDACTGFSVGPCELVCSLSAGAGKTFLAQRDGESLVVLRRLDADPAAIPDLQSHGELIARINHGHLARVLAVESTDEGVFWQTEYAPGASLEEIRAACKKVGKSLPLGLVFSTLHEAALAVAELHGRHLAHGDFRDANVLVTFGGVTKVLNPGVADCLQRLPPDPPCDVLALANLLYECLTGQVASGPAFAHPSSFNHALEKPVDDLIARALGPDRSKRFKTAGDLAQALKSAAGAYMWKPQQRADFVASLFKTRKHREATLLASARARLEAMHRERKAAAAASRAADEAAAITAIEELPVVMGERLPEDGPGIPPPMPRSKKARRAQGRVMGSAVAALVAIFVVAQLWPSETFVAPPIMIPTPPQAEALARPVPLPDAVLEAPALEPVSAPIGDDADADKPKVKKHKKRSSGGDAPVPPWLMRKGRR